MLANVNFLASPTNNVLQGKLAKMVSAQMAVQTTRTVLDNMSVFKEDVLILALSERLVDQTANVRPRTRLNIALALQDLLVYQLLFKDAFGFLTNALASSVQVATNASMVTVCLDVASMLIAPRENNVSMECA